MVHSTFVHTYGLSMNDKKDGFLRLIIFTIVKITSTDKEMGTSNNIPESSFKACWITSISACIVSLMK